MIDPNIIMCPHRIKGYCDDCLEALIAENKRLAALLDTPHTGDFLTGVRLEAGHQLKRWGTEHDEGKQPADWLWLIGYLAGKALHAVIAGDIEKAKHHTISSAAVLLNWHRRISGDDMSFKPGISTPSIADTTAKDCEHCSHTVFYGETHVCRVRPRNQEENLHEQ